MSADQIRFLLLSVFTAAAFLTLGRAPASVQLKTRDFEIALQGETRPGRDRRAMIIWLSGGSSA